MLPTSRSLGALAGALGLALALAPAGFTRGDDLGGESAGTVALFRKTDPGLGRFFDASAGYAVFPTVGKGGVGIGGAYGKGVLYERGKPVGEARLTQVTLGLQLGGQAYSEVIFFENEATLKSFKRGQFAVAAQASAVAAAEGVAAHARYELGVAIFTIAKGGLMYEASVGGQKFSFSPYGRR